MLDGMSLADKLWIAREWFRRARSGEFAFTERNKDKFAELLATCEEQARAAENTLPITIEGDNVVLFGAAAAARARGAGR